MNITDAEETMAQAILEAAVRSARVRALLRINMSRLAGEVGCSTTLVRRHLLGETVGAESAARIRAVLLEEE